MNNRYSRGGLSQWFHLLVAAASTGGAMAFAAGCAGAKTDPTLANDAGLLDAAVQDASSSPDGGRDLGRDFDSGILSDAGTKSLCPSATSMLVDRVKLAEPVDYFLLRSLVDLGTPTSNQPIFNQDSVGTPCSAASDANTCKADLAAKLTNATVGWNVSSGGQIRTTRAGFFTRKDTVGTVASLEELRAFVAPVDTLADAALLASEKLQTKFNCDTDRVEPKADGDYEVTFYAVNRGCGTSPSTKESVDYIESTETKVVVKVDGTVGAPVVKVLNRTESPAVTCPVVGRRVEGTTVGCGAGQPTVGEFFAEIATLEALAVSAFARLAEELSVHGAPEELIASARRSQADEVRHARTMGAMARRYGAPVAPVPEVTLSPRTLFEMAIENAVEGCVRETFGGLMATYQADHAEDETVARVFQAIADEETGHGALAWEVAAWLETKLTEAERRLVLQARHRALADLLVELEQEPREDLARAVGLPNAAVATALCRAMGDGLLRDAA